MRRKAVLALLSGLAVIGAGLGVYLVGDESSAKVSSGGTAGTTQSSATGPVQTPSSAAATSSSTTTATASQGPATTQRRSSRPRSPDAACGGAAPVANRAGLWGVPAQGRAVNLFAGQDGDLFDGIARSPDGTRYAFFVSNAARDGAELVVADRQRSISLATGLAVGPVAWADGDHLVFGQEVDAPDGSGRRAELKVVDVRDAAVTSIWQQPAPQRVEAMVGHPAGGKVLFVLAGADAGRFDDAVLAEVAIDGSGFRQVTTGLDSGTRLVLSPDGVSIAAIARGSRVVIDVATGAIRALGPSPQGSERPRSFPGPGYLPDNVLGWSPNGAWVAFLYGGGYNGARISILPVGGGTPIYQDGVDRAFRLPTYRGLAFSYDSTQAIVVQRLTRVPEIETQTLSLSDGSRRTLLPGGDTVLAGSNNTVLTGEGFESLSVCRMSPDGSNAEPVLRSTAASGKTLSLEFSRGREESIRMSQALIVPL